jgi:hypothetical protein
MLLLYQTSSKTDGADVPLKYPVSGNFNKII